MRHLRTVRGFSPAPTWSALLGSLVLIATVSASARSAEPDRSPRRYFPARGLVGYLEYQGLDAHSKAWQATAAHDLLVKTPTGAMLTDVFKQLVDRTIKEYTLGALDASATIDTMKQLVRKGLACGFFGSEKGDRGAVVVLRAFAVRRQLRRFDPLREFLAGQEVLTGPRPIRGREVYRVHDPSAELDAKNPLH